MIKYKLSDVAKDLNIPAKELLEMVSDLTGEAKKHSSPLTDAELNQLFEKLTTQNEESSLDAYLSSVSEPEEPKKEEPVKAPAKPAAAAPAKPAAPQRPQQQKAPAAKRKERIRMPKEEKADRPAPEKREVVTVTVDTRVSDVNLDKFNEKYTDLASTKNVENRRKPTPAGNKQKFGNKKNRNQPFQKKRETEAERLQRIQLEKARKAQLKVSIPDEITVGDLATRLKVNVAQVIKKLMGLGVMAAISEVIDFDTASLVAEELGAKVEHEVHVTIEERLFEVDEDKEEDLQERPPVVVVMGHVDHGKTSILDAIRKTRVTAGEAGGITQHIGAYQVEKNGKIITFLDTPGHEAFTSMRARGANLTDIAVLVVAADDGIMPQTVESINHAKAAGVTVIVAINKMDKPTANPTHVMEQLTQYELVPEEWGGETICVPVSALTGQGIEDLLENILLVAEVKELKANPNRRAKGAVIEARLDKGQGPVATILVQKGTLHQGDIVIAGTAVGRVRVMRDDQGRNLKDAGPSTPVEITGLTEVPAAGDIFDAVEDEKLARELADKRAAEAKEKQFAAYKKVTLDNLFSQIAEGERKELAIIVKADVQGSLEAILGSLEKLGTDEVAARILHAGVGGISESDVTLAEGFNAAIIGFSVRANKEAAALAKRDGIEIRYYNIIYDLVDDVKKAMSGLLAPTLRETMLGNAQILEVFNISKVGKIAGCRVTDGSVERGANVRLIRDNVVVHEGKLSTLKRFKDEVKEVQSGQECGMAFENYQDMRVGDVIECYRVETIQRSL